MRGVSAPLPAVDVASAAKAYADFGGLLVGFAFVALFAYLKEMPRRSAGQGHKGKPQQDGAAPDVTEGHVTLTVLFAMASLTMTSFLYASLAGEAASEPPALAAAALVPYGVAFGVSVLMLFYALTLVMLERRHKAVASWSYWMVACVGPAVVLRFLLGAAANAREVMCDFKCGPGWPLSRWWMFAAVALAAAAAATFMLMGLGWEPIRGLRDRLRDLPAGPPIAVFVGVALMTGLVSLYFTGPQPSFPPVSWMVTAAMWVAVLAVAAFAVACGCVIGPRVDVARPPGWWSKRAGQSPEKQADAHAGQTAGTAAGRATPRTGLTMMEVIGIMALAGMTAGLVVLISAAL
jgi:hypothetical protein